jgi:hypothetical protein
VVIEDNIDAGVMESRVLSKHNDTMHATTPSQTSMQIPNSQKMGGCGSLVKLDYDVMMAGVNIQLTTFTPSNDFSF